MYDNYQLNRKQNNVHHSIQAFTIEKQKENSISNTRILTTVLEFSRGRIGMGNVYAFGHTLWQQMLLF